MINQRKIRSNHWRNNLILLFCIVILFIVGPAFSLVANSGLISSIFITLLILSGIYAAEYKKIVFKVLVIIGGISIAALWIEEILFPEAFGFIAFVFTSLVLLLITFALIAHIASSKIVSADIILSAVNGYLLLGIVGGLLYIIIDLNSPGSLSANFTPKDGIAGYIYFSYVTLTTLGYGEIVPISNGAKAVTMLLAISGPLYLAILIATLVGKFQNQAQSKSKILK